MVIPWRDVDGRRSRNLDWTLAQLRRDLPGVEVILSVDHSEGLFNRSWGIVGGALEASGDVVVVMDGDVWLDGDLGEAVEVASTGRWVVPHWFLRRLSDEASWAVLRGVETPGPHLPLDQPAYKGNPGGTMLVAPRDMILDVPPDVRFVGWGQEDDAWCAALTGLVGPGVRQSADLYHLWHEPQPRMSRLHGNADGVELVERYGRVRRDRHALRELVDESKTLWVSSAGRDTPGERQSDADTRC